MDNYDDSMKTPNEFRRAMSISKDYKVSISVEHSKLIPNDQVYIRAKERFLEYKNNGYMGLDSELVDVLDSINLDKIVPIFSCVGHVSRNKGMGGRIYNGGKFYLTFVTTDVDWIYGLFKHLITSLTELNREQHHLIGAEILYKVARELNVDIPIESLGLAVKAIEEHRASFKGQFSSKYSEVLSAADRGKSIKEDLIIRCWEYTRPKHESQITCAKAVAEHLKDKYSNTGYARYPDLYMETYSKELQKIKKFFDNVNFLTILDIVNSALLRV